MDSKIVDGVATNISGLSSAAAKDYPPSSSGNTYIKLETPTPSTDGKHTVESKISVGHLPDNFAVGMKLEGGNWTHLTSDTAHAHLAMLDFPSDLTDFAGDIWHGLETFGNLVVQGFQDAEVNLSDSISFVITKSGDVLQFVLNIADTVIRISLETFVLVFKALNFVFKLIGIDLTVVSAWSFPILSMSTDTFLLDIALAGSSVWMGPYLGYSQTYCQNGHE